MKRRHVRAAMAMAVLIGGFLPASVLGQAEGNLADRITRLERALDNKGLVALLQQLEMLQQELRQLRGELENQVFALEQVRKSQREAYADIDQRLGLIENGGVTAPAIGGVPGVPADPPLPTLTTPAGVAVAGTPSDQAIAVDIRAPGVATAAAPGAFAPGAFEPENPAAPEDPAPPLISDAGGDVALTDPMPPPPDTPRIVSAPTPSILPPTPTVDSAESETAYRDAFAMLKAGQYDESIAAFNNFLQQYPTSQYADNAQYWLGEAYYVMRQFEPAIDQYQKLVNGYPESKKQSHAMLKIAYSYHELGLPEQAVGVLTELKTRYPGSAAARLADERMQRIRAEAP